MPFSELMIVVPFKEEGDISVGKMDISRNELAHVAPTHGSRLEQGRPSADEPASTLVGQNAALVAEGAPVLVGAFSELAYLVVESIRLLSAA